MLQYDYDLTHTAHIMRENISVYTGKQLVFRVREHGVRAHSVKLLVMTLGSMLDSKV